MDRGLKHIISYRLKINKKIFVLITLLLVSIIFSRIIVYAKDSPTRTVNIGYFAFSGYHEMKEEYSNPIGSGYGSDFLRLLRRYTNLNYNYIGYEKSWQDMLEMLRNGEIDILTSARKTSVREKEFAFSKPIGTSYAEMSVREDDSRYDLDDYDSFNGMTIGVLPGNSRNKDLEQLAKEKGFIYRAVEYNCEEDLTKALQNSEVDAIITSSLRKRTDEKIVARFALEEFYVIVRKDDIELLEEINYGIEQMDLNEGDWKNRLYYKYTSKESEVSLSFTQREKDYIAAVQSGEKMIKACAQPDRDPYSFVENGNLVGIIPQYFDYLMDMAGLPYTVMTAENRSQYYEWLENNTVDIYMDVNEERDKILKEETGVSTDPYIQMTMSRVTKKDFKGAIHTVAVAYQQTYDGIDVDLAKNVQIIEFDTRQEAMQAVKDGKADACYVYTYMAEKFVNQNPDGELIFHMMNKPVYNMVISIRPTTDHELISILNKCLKADQSHMLDELVEKYTRYEQGEVTLIQFARQNPWFVVAIVSICIGTMIVLVLVVKNNKNMRSIVAERLKYAANLKKKNEELEYSISQEQSANFAKTTFLNNMSHDIRTPMNAIIGFTSIALKQKPNPQVKECLEKISESSEHLLTLINDVLDLSRIESGKVEYIPIPTNLCSLTETVIAITQGFLTDRKLTFQTEYSNLEQYCAVLADPVRIREVLVNILSNAVKFTEDGGTIALFASCRPYEDDSHIIVCFTITDTGVGMSEEYIKHIFDEFSQEESSARTQYKGTGLGMAITKRYVDLMGGIISVKSKKGEGSTFTVELPLELTDKNKIQEKNIHKVKENLKDIKVLLAEDNDLNAEIATIQMEELGMKLTRAVDGREAVKIFKDNPPDTFDIILMDIMMPRMNGYEAVQAIRTMNDRPDGSSIPIIAMTANAFAEDVQASLDAGMNAHLAKPIEMDEVMKTIARNLKQ